MSRMVAMYFWVKEPFPCRIKRDQYKFTQEYNDIMR